MTVRNLRLSSQRQCSANLILVQIELELSVYLAVLATRPLQFGITC